MNIISLSEMKKIFKHQHSGKVNNEYRMESYIYRLINVVSDLEQLVTELSDRLLAAEKRLIKLGENKNVASVSEKKKA